MSEPPRIEMRPERRYVGTRMVTPMRDFDRQIPAMAATVSRWLEAHHVGLSGHAFLRYHVIDMPERMDVEFGMPTDGVDAASGEVAGQLLPAGRYAVFTYMGVENGVPATRALLDWIAARGEQPIAHASGHGEVFAARYETFLIDDRSEPDRHRWMIELAIQVRN